MNPGKLLVIPRRHAPSDCRVYVSALWQHPFPKIQFLTFGFLTFGEILEAHKKPDIPASAHSAYMKARRYIAPAAQLSLGAAASADGDLDEEPVEDAEEQPKTTRPSGVRPRRAGSECHEEGPPQ